MADEKVVVLRFMRPSEIYALLQLQRRLGRHVSLNIFSAKQEGPLFDTFVTSKYDSLSFTLFGFWLPLHIHGISYFCHELSHFEMPMLLL